MSLDRLHLPDLVKKRACVMTSVPKHRNALRVVLEEATAEQLACCCTILVQAIFVRTSLCSCERRGFCLSAFSVQSRLVVPNSSRWQQSGGRRGWSKISHQCSGHEQFRQSGTPSKPLQPKNVVNPCQKTSGLKPFQDPAARMEVASRKCQGWSRRSVQCWSVPESSQREPQSTFKWRKENNSCSVRATIETNIANTKAPLERLMAEVGTANAGRCSARLGRRGSKVARECAEFAAPFPHVGMFKNALMRRENGPQTLWYAKGSCS